MREKLGRIIESTFVRHFIITIILINAVTLGMETSHHMNDQYGHILHIIDTIILYIFVVEILCKLFAFRFKFFSKPWNIFDFLIVGIALLPASGPFAVLRILRVLRVLLLLSMVKRLRFVVEALLQAIPGIISIMGLMVIIYYIFAVMGTQMFGSAFPKYFGDLGRSMYTLFQVMTLESWSSNVARPIISLYPAAWLYFVLFILIGTFTMLNLFIGIIVNAMQSLHEKNQHDETDNIKTIISKETDILEAKIFHMQQSLTELHKMLKDHWEKDDKV